MRILLEWQVQLACICARSQRSRSGQAAIGTGYTVHGRIVILIAVLLGSMSASRVFAEDTGRFTVGLRHRVETAPNSGRYHTLTRKEIWSPDATAVIVCDMWDSHHCLNAVRRVKQMAPRMNKLLEHARDAGALIIHAPSGCMEFYSDHPGRILARTAPAAANLPEDIGKWCYQIPAEEQGKYPLDQSDGGEDDDPEEHARWEAELRSKGLDSRRPWSRQIDLLEIHKGDAISDSGVAIWNLMEERGIKNVILVGVHTNMCVLGRPFGLRQMSRNGKNVVLVRDLTDTMYNPDRWPYVSHFTGTDRIVEHIEKYVCPTILSTDLLGGQEFRFHGDDRKHLAMIIGEQEYNTRDTLPKFAGELLGHDFRVSYVYRNREDRHDLPGIEVLDDADVALISVRRCAPKRNQMSTIRRFLEAGKPLVAIRTSSHAFDPRQYGTPEGHVAWPDFDREVLGCNYQGHHGSKPTDPETSIWTAKQAASSPLLTGIPAKENSVESWLYKHLPLADDATPIMWGRAGDRQPHEPVAWTHHSPWDGRVFYTMLGHPKDFENPNVTRLLINGLYWAAGIEVPESLPERPGEEPAVKQ